MKRHRGVAVAFLAPLVACAGAEATGWTVAAPPPLTATALDAGAATRTESRDAGASVLDETPGSAAATPPRAQLPTPAFGSEPLAPSAAHAFRLAVALRATRAATSGAKVLRVLAALPQVRAMKAETGVDPLADGEWLLVYGSRVAVPGPNANVLEHSRSAADVAGALADAGVLAGAAGAPGPAGAAGAAGATGAWPSELFGVNDVVLLPQRKLLALVPADRARDLARELGKPIDPGLKGGELARMFVAEPAQIVRFVPATVTHATVIVKAGTDGGLDLAADADCPDAAACKTIASDLEELVRRQNGMLVRIVLGNVLGSFAARADGTKLHASMHARPDHVDAALGFLRSELGLPAADPDAGAP